MSSTRSRTRSFTVASLLTILGLLLSIIQPIAIARGSAAPAVAARASRAQPAGEVAVSDKTAPPPRRLPPPLRPARSSSSSTPPPGKRCGSIWRGKRWSGSGLQALDALAQELGVSVARPVFAHAKPESDLANVFLLSSSRRPGCAGCRQALQGAAGRGVC